MVAVCLPVCGVEHSSSELLMRWSNEEKVTHFTVPVLWPLVSSKSVTGIQTRRTKAWYNRYFGGEYSKSHKIARGPPQCNNLSSVSQNNNTLMVQLV